MGMEIERRFHVRKDSWRALAKGKENWYKQGYLSVDPMRMVRVRVVGNQAWITLKSALTAMSRYEFEYPIPLKDAQVIFATMCAEAMVEKRRYHVTIGNALWEIDEFYGANAGLVLAEIELDDENAVFERPEWLDEEVTFDERYTNAYLSQHPYKTWPDEEVHYRGLTK